MTHFSKRIPVVTRDYISVVKMLPVGGLQLLPYLSGRARIAAIPSHTTTTFIIIVLRKLKIMKFLSFLRCCTVFLISNFRRVLYVVYFLLGNSTPTCL
jgi:hypothetical protein